MMASIRPRRSAEKPPSAGAPLDKPTGDADTAGLASSAASAVPATTAIASTMRPFMAALLRTSLLRLQRLRKLGFHPLVAFLEGLEGRGLRRNAVKTLRSISGHAIGRQTAVGHQLVQEMGRFGLFLEHAGEVDTVRDRPR